MTATQTEWRNWSGRHAARHHVQRPQSIDELGHAIATAQAPLRMLGSGHSFSPIAQCDGIALDLGAFAALRTHDSIGPSARVGAAMTIGTLAATLKNLGQALPNMGDIDRQAFAGALATGTHGSGLGLGAYHTLLSHIQLVDGRGRLRDIVAADEVAALGCTLGAFGALTEVTLTTVPDYRLRRRRFKIPLADVLHSFDALMRQSRSVEFFIIPHWDHAAMVTSELTDAPATHRPPDHDEAALAALRRLRSTCKGLPWLRAKILSLALSRFEEEDYVEDWLKVYPSERRTRFHEMEYHLPLEDGPKALADIIALLKRQFSGIYFPIEVRTVAADDVWLSPFYQRPTCSIAVHHAATEDPMPYFKACEAIFRRFNGRPHWGKMHALTAKELAPLYPKWHEAMALRREFDPDNRFVTPYMAALFGLADAA